MPLYVYEDQDTGACVELIRPVEERDKPVTITLRRRTVPQRISVVAGGIGEPTFNDTIRQAYRTLELEKGSRFRPQHDINTIKKGLALPPATLPT